MVYPGFFLNPKLISEETPGSLSTRKEEGDAVWKNEVFFSKKSGIFCFCHSSMRHGLKNLMTPLFS